MFRHVHVGWLKILALYGENVLQWQLWIMEENTELSSYDCIRVPGQYSVMLGQRKLRNWKSFWIFVNLIR